MKTRNNKEKSASAADNNAGTDTPMKNAEVLHAESIGVLTRSQKKRLSAVGTTPNAKPSSKETPQSSVRKKHDASEGKNVQNSKKVSSTRQTSKVQQTIKEEDDKGNVITKVENIVGNKSECATENSNQARRELFCAPSSNESDDDDRAIKAKFSKSKCLSAIDESEIKNSEALENVKESEISMSDESKSNIKDFKQNDKIDKKNELPNRHDSQGSTTKKKSLSSEVEEVKPNLMKNFTALDKSKSSDSEECSNLELLSQSSVNCTSQACVEPSDKTPSKVNEQIKAVEKKTSLAKVEGHNLECEIDKKNSPIKHESAESSETEDDSSEESSDTDQNDTKRTASNLSFKEPGSLNVSQNEKPGESRSSNNSKNSAKKILSTFGRYEAKSPMMLRKSISSKEDEETTESDSDAESRKAIKESAQKRIIQNISTSESESRKSVPPVKTLQHLKISSDSDSAPENVSFGASRQQAEETLQQVIECIQRERKRRKEKRRERLEKFKQQKEEKLIRLKEKRASQEDASCSSSEESPYEEDEAGKVPLSKSAKASTVAKEKENIDDVLPHKRRKLDGINSKIEEKKTPREVKIDLPADQEQEPCLGKLKKLADDILENLADTVPIKLRKIDESTSSERKKKKMEKHKYNKGLTVSGGIKRDVDYIPLNTCGATEFGAIPLNKMMRAPKTLAEQAAEFRKQMFYGSHIKRVSGNANQVYQQKLKASGKDRFVR